MAGALCCRVDAEHTVVVAPAGAAARWRRIAREAIVVGNPIAFADRSADLTVLSLVGPRARRLLTSAGLTGEPADVRTTALAGVPVVLVREHDDGYLVVVGDDGAESAWRALIDAGAPLGLALVGSDALARLAAAQRTFV
jgi:glycine cleavage system aminomethyltransferase T